MHFAENVHANWQEEYCFIMTARHHTARATQKRSQELQWELLEHPPHRPDLDPSDFHLFGPPKTTLVTKVSLMTRCRNDVRKWLRQNSKYFYAAGFDALAKRWNKCINAGGGYVEKCFFPGSKINVLRFIPICDLFTDSPS
jgi:hypothetical protein